MLRNVRRREAAMTRAEQLRLQRFGTGTELSMAQSQAQAQSTGAAQPTAHTPAPEKPTSAAAEKPPPEKPSSAAARPASTAQEKQPTPAPGTPARATPAPAAEAPPAEQPSAPPEGASA